MKAISKQMKEVKIAQYRYTAIVLVVLFLMVSIMFCAYMATEMKPTSITKNNYEYKEVPVNYTIKMETQDKVILLDKNEYQEVK